MNKTKILALLLATSFALALPGCLKTRSQIKGGGDSAEQGDAQNGDDAKGAPQPRGNYEIEEMKNEITRLSGKLEEVDHNQRGMNFSELKEYTTRLDARIADLEKNQVLVMSELKALKDKESATAAAAREAAVPASNLFTQGNQLLSEKKCEEAAEKFKLILNKNIKGKEAADAHFGLGEAEYCQKNYKKAIVQYDKVKDASAKSSKIPASLYKIGLSFQHLSMNKEANGFFSELIEKYPKSPEAKKARAKVKE